MQRRCLYWLLFIRLILYTKLLEEEKKKKSNDVIHGNKAFLERLIFLCSVQVPCISWDPNVMEDIARTRHFFIGTQINPVYTLLYYLFKTYFNIILPFKSRSGKWLLFIRFSPIKLDTHTQSFQCSLLFSFV